MSVTRLVMLRAGYAALGIAFAGLAATVLSGSLLLPSLLVALLGGVLLAFSQDDLPKWAGLALVAYFLLSIVAFVAATPITVDRGGERWFVNKAPPELADDIIYWIGLASPLMLGATAVAAAWEREWAARVLLLGAIGGFLLVAILSIVLVPQGDTALAAEAARTQGNAVETLFAVSAAAGAIGTLWAATRADFYA